MDPYMTRERQVLFDSTGVSMLGSDLFIAREKHDRDTPGSLAHVRTTLTSGGALE